MEKIKKIITAGLVHFFLLAILIIVSINLICIKNFGSFRFIKNITDFFIEEKILDSTSRSVMFLQKEKYTCGPACVAFVLSSFGLNIDENMIMQFTDTTPNGTSMLSLVNVVKKFGFYAWGEQQNYEALLLERLPLIAFIDNDHYIVILKADENSIDAFDPGQGNIKIRKDYFISIWDGIVMKICPENIKYE